MKLGTGLQPLSVQIIPAQGTAMAEIKKQHIINHQNSWFQRVSSSAKTWHKDRECKLKHKYKDFEHWVGMSQQPILSKVLTVSTFYHFLSF